MLVRTRTRVLNNTRVTGCRGDTTPLGRFCFSRVTMHREQQRRRDQNERTKAHRADRTGRVKETERETRTTKVMRDRPVCVSMYARFRGPSAAVNAVTAVTVVTAGDRHELPPPPSSHRCSHPRFGLLVPLFFSPLYLATSRVVCSFVVLKS